MNTERLSINKLWLVVAAAAGVLAGVVIARQVGHTADLGLTEQPQAHYVGTIRDVMHAIVEPASDAVFDSVEIDVSAEGIKEKQPRTPEEWEAVEHGAIAMAEAVTLIKMPGRPVARPEEMDVDPDGPELPPSTIAAHIARSQAEWDRHADRLLQRAIEAAQVARARDVKGLFTIGSTLDEACEGCHLAFWYPDDLKNRTRQ